jgi:hypothetical protein
LRGCATNDISGYCFNPQLETSSYCHSHALLTHRRSMGRQTHADWASSAIADVKRAAAENQSGRKTVVRCESWEMSPALMGDLFILPGRTDSPRHRRRSTSRCRSSRSQRHRCRKSGRRLPAHGRPTAYLPRPTGRPLVRAEGLFASSAALKPGRYPAFAGTPSTKPGSGQ